MAKAAPNLPNKCSLSLVLFLLLWPTLAQAEQIARVRDGTTVELADGRQLVLLGITAPPASATALAGLVLQQDVQVATIGPPDRYGRQPARLQLPDQRDVAHEMLAQGAAQIFPPTLRGSSPTLWAAESTARIAGRGLWQQPTTRLITADEAEKFTNSWRVVEGTVMQLTTRGSTTYVNFGTDWKTDFTLRLPSRLALKLKPENWIGQKIRARGWLAWRNGPEIEVKSATQIEITP